MREEQTSNEKPQVTLAGHYLEESLCVYLQLAEDGARWVLDGPIVGYSQYEGGPEWRNCECGASNEEHQAAAALADESLSLPTGAELRELIDATVEAPPPHTAACPRENDDTIALGPAQDAVDAYARGWGRHRDGDSLVADLIVDLLHVAAMDAGSRSEVIKAAEALLDSAGKHFRAEIEGDALCDPVDLRGYDRSWRCGHSDPTTEPKHLANT